MRKIVWMVMAVAVALKATYKNGSFEDGKPFRLVKVKGDWKITLGW